MSVGLRGKIWYVDYTVGKGKDRKRIREAIGPRKGDAVARYSKIMAAKRENRLYDIKKEPTHTFDELLQKYTDTFQHQRSFGSKKCRLVYIEKFFKGKLLHEITVYDL